MKTNTRILFTIITSTVAVAAIKQLYFYITKHKELDMYWRDYLIIGGSSGLLISQITFGGIFIIYGGVIGMFYGYFYSKMARFFINRRIKNAEKIGLSL
jgi:hypothetical protein